MFKFLAFKVLYCLQKCPYFLELDIKTMYHCLVSSHLFVISLVFTNNRPDKRPISSDNLFVIAAADAKLSLKLISTSLNVTCPGF